MLKETLFAEAELRPPLAAGRRVLPIFPGPLPAAGRPPSNFSVAPPPWFHLIEAAEPLVLIVEGSRLFTVEPEFFRALKNHSAAAETELASLLAAPRPERPARADFSALEAPTAISLNIAQNCNLSCSYCYADEGRFGGKANLMTEETAFAAIDGLLAGAGGKTVTVGFIGGEPFLNPRVLHAAAGYALEQARPQKTRVGFSVTTNGTLLTAPDIELLRDQRFTVTVSLDGAESVNDRFRRSRKKDRKSFAPALAALAPLLQNPGGARLSARATVTREDLRVLDRIEALAAAGFTDIGVSPLRDSPQPKLALNAGDWPDFLSEMIAAGESELDRLRRGEALRFSNLAESLRQIHRGTNRSLPCGSTVNYISVSAAGEYFTCHRTIDRPQLGLGNLTEGLSEPARQRFLEARQVEKQEPCTSCWARYLCGGGCHAEVLSVGRGGCDYIRGWLEFSLHAYDRILRENPDFFEF